MVHVVECAWVCVSLGVRVETRGVKTYGLFFSVVSLSYCLETGSFWTRSCCLSSTVWPGGLHICLFLPVNVGSNWHAWVNTSWKSGMEEKDGVAVCPVHTHDSFLPTVYSRVMQLESLNPSLHVIATHSQGSFQCCTWGFDECAVTCVTEHCSLMFSHLE